jgi:hypothetical protein
MLARLPEDRRSTCIMYFSWYDPRCMTCDGLEPTGTGIFVGMIKTGQEIFVEISIEERGYWGTRRTGGNIRDKRQKIFVTAGGPARNGRYLCIGFTETTDACVLVPRS